jgi:hypothetical protein
LNAVTLYLIPSAIVILSGFLMAWHVRQWRAGDQDADERRYQRGRFRRRMQSSAMLCLSGVAMYAGQLISADQQPTLYVFFWCGVALLVLWVMILALADILATRLHIARFKRHRIVEEARLRAELARASALEGNGKPSRGDR